MIAAPDTTKVPTSRHGAILALKGFAINCALILVFGLAERWTHSPFTPWVGGVSYGVGALYIIASLWIWNRRNDIIRGELIAWIVAALFILGPVGAFFQGGGGGTLPASPSQNSPAAIVPARSRSAP